MNDIHAKSAGKIPIKWWPTFSFIFENTHTAAKSIFLFKIKIKLRIITVTNTTQFFNVYHSSALLIRFFCSKQNCSCTQSRQQVRFRYPKNIRGSPGRRGLNPASSTRPRGGFFRRQFYRLLFFF